MWLLEGGPSGKNTCSVTTDFEKGIASTYGCKPDIRESEMDRDWWRLLIC